MVPQLKGKICISCAQTTDKMVFEGLDGAFGIIDSVVFNKLYGTGSGCDKRFYGCGCLIVGDIERWGVSFGGEDIKDRGEGFDDVVTLC